MIRSSNLKLLLNITLKILLKLNPVLKLKLILKINCIQISIEPTKASIGSYIDLPPDLKNSKSILKIRNYKYNGLQITITAWLHPAMDHAPLESKYVNILIEPS